VKNAKAAITPLSTTIVSVGIDALLSVRANDAAASAAPS